MDYGAEIIYGMSQNKSHFKYNLVKWNVCAEGIAQNFFTAHMAGFTISLETTDRAAKIVYIAYCTKTNIEHLHLD